MKRLTIACDLDGVVIDFTRAVLETCADVLGIHAKREDVNQWNFCKALKLRSSQCSALWDAINAPSWHDRLNPLPNAEGALCALSAKHDLFFVTTSCHRSKTWDYDRRQWLKQRGMDRWDVVFARNKVRVGADVFIDDKPETVAAYEAAHPSARAILHPALYNRRLQFGFETMTLAQLAESGARPRISNGGGHVFNGDNHVGGKIRQTRKSVGMSIDTLAARAGVALSCIKRAEHAQNPNIKTSTVRLVAQALGVTIEELIE